jgi:hypothetical protein
MFQFNRFPVKDDDGNVDEAAYNSLKDILTCPAADALEMSSFTQGMFNYYFSVVNKEQPSYIMMNSVTTIRSLTSNKLFKQMSYNITAKLFDGTFIDSDYFDKEYSPNNPRLAAAVQGFIEKFQAKERRQAEFEAREAKRERHTREDNEAANYAAKQIKIEYKAAKDAMWKAVGESYRQKVQTGKKNFTAMEVRYA